MGGAVSSGRDNNELIDNLMSGNYIRTRQVERVLRALDRAEYMTPEARDQAYKDLAWRNGPLHLSSPCIYSEVMEGLDLRPGLSFLNVGSGTGYLSTLVGLILGTSGISHGVEVHPAVYEYAVKKLSQFMENSPILDDFDFCEPKFYLGNALCLSPLQSCYDRVYCGAACTEEYVDYFKRLIKVGGVLVMPLNDTLQHVLRTGESSWATRNMLNVSFATLRAPTREEAAQPLALERQAPARLQLLARGVVRGAMWRGVLRRHPELREAPRPPPPADCPRRICIPIDPADPVEGLNVLHDLDGENGANEMNALLSLVISMGHNRVAGALRFDRVDDSSSISSGDEDEAARETPAEAAEERPEEPSRPRPEDAGPTRENRDTESDTSLKSDSDVDEDKKLLWDKQKNWTWKDSTPAGNTRQSRRTRQARGDRDERTLPPACRDLLYRLDEPSTSRRSSQTAASRKSGGSKKKGVATKKDNKKNSKGSKAIPPSVPSEVEIDLGTKMAQKASTSQMDWDEIQTDTQEVEGSEEDTQKTNSKAKRQKLDSGIGDATPSGSSPEKSKTESDSEQSCSPADDAASPNSGARSDEECAELRAHEARRRRRIARGGDARRVRLSLLMKQAVRELPLPHALKKFVNLGRCFEF